ncbi:MAG: ribonuclease H-like domain-containing protein [Planctomycetota bacterium]|nr:ribonuclease H-like domain-containing protein [Planctomycetota bacterium]
MLKHTFCHLPGVGPRSEQRLWAAGVHTWDALTDDAGLGLPARRRDALRQNLDDSIRHLDDGNARFFGESLSSDQAWRLFPEFCRQTAYLDIETTGLGGPGDHITTIALYDGANVRHYIHGQNLDDFAGDIAAYKVLVTYNGKCFDVPFIRQSLGLRLDQAHIDLRFVLKSLGHGGGLKACERKLGLERGDLEDVDGYFAVLLWHEYRRRGDAKALDTLLAYNIQDVLNLETLMVTAYNAKLQETPFRDRVLPQPQPARNPFHADRATVQRLKRAMGFAVGA